MRMMKNSVTLLLIIVWICSGCESEGTPPSSLPCSEDDRDALLRFKGGILEDPTGALGNWTGEDCCRWNGVHCHPLTGRVTKIFLKAKSPDQSMRGTISESISNLTCLNEFGLVDWKNIRGSIPSSIFSLSNLQLLALDGNGLTGSIPRSIGNLTRLSILSLSNNRLRGQIPRSLGRMSNLMEVSLRDNLLEGGIPESMGNLSRLFYLDLSGNKLHGPLPKSFENLSNLLQLDLSENNLSNPLPDLINFDIYSLDLSHNNLRMGDNIPDWITMADSVNSLGLAGCGIKMRLNDWKPANPESYTSIDISGNQITGNVSNFFQGMAYLEYANLSGNRLTSDLTNVSFSDHLRVLDLHSNRLYGRMHSLFVHVGQSCGDGGCLAYVDLSDNGLYGKMPRVINQKNVRWLDVSGNGLMGSISPSIARMRGMEYLDLSKNRFSGRIPRQILNMKSLKSLNVSYNRLCGEIPRGRPLNAFPISSYSHNDCLCGSPLPRCNNWL